MRINPTGVSKGRYVGKYRATITLDSFPDSMDYMTFARASITLNSNSDFVGIFLTNLGDCLIDFFVNVLIEVGEISHNVTPYLIRAYDGFQPERIWPLLSCFFK